MPRISGPTWIELTARQQPSAQANSTVLVGAGVSECALHPGQRINLHDFYGGLRDLQVRVAFECLCRRLV